MEPASAPVDVFRSHRANIQSEIEVSVESLAGHCRDADIISTQLHQELVLVTGTPVSKEHKAKKLVTALSQRIEAQSVQPVDQDHCALRLFIGALKKDSHNNVAELLETSLTGVEAIVSEETVATAVVSQETSPERDTETERADNPTAACTDDQDDPLDQSISSNHILDISKQLENWKLWAESLKLNRADISGIEGDSGLTYIMRCQQVLRTWRNSHTATYRALCKVGIRIGQRITAEWICKLVNGDWSSICPPSPPETRLVTTTAGMQPSRESGRAEPVYLQSNTSFGETLAKKVVSFSEFDMEEIKLKSNLEAEKIENKILACKLKSKDEQLKSKDEQLKLKDKELILVNEKMKSAKKHEELVESKLLKELNERTQLYKELQERSRALREEFAKIREQLTTEKEELSARYLKLDENFKQLTKEYDKIMKENEEVKKENEKLVRVNEEVTKENEKLMRVNEEVTKENEKLMRVNEEVMKENEKLMRVNEEVMKENENLKEENKKLKVKFEECEILLREREINITEIKAQDEGLKKVLSPQVQTTSV